MSDDTRCPSCGAKRGAEYTLRTMVEFAAIAAVFAFGIGWLLGWRTT